MDPAEMLSTATKIDLTTETPKEEAKPEEVKPPEKVEPKADPVSARLAQLAREKKAFEEERKKWETEKSSPDFELVDKYKKLKASAKEDPFSVLEEFDLDYDFLTDYVVSGKKPRDPALRSFEEKLKKLEEDKKNSETAAQKKLQEAQLQNFIDKIASDIKDKGDEFELINAYDAHKSVYNLIQKHYDEHEEVLPTLEAAAKIEKHLEDESKKYSKVKKLKSLFATLEESKVEEKQSQEEIQTTKTLSNAGSSSSTTTVDDENLSAADLLAKATKLISK